MEPTMEMKALIVTAFGMCMGGSIILAYTKMIVSGSIIYGFGTYVLADVCWRLHKKVKKQIEKMGEASENGDQTE